MLSKNYSVEIVVNYGKPSDHLAFPLDKDIKLTFLSPLKPTEISLKKIITSLKWHQIPKELIRRFKINLERNRVFNVFLKTLDTDYIITDRALYNSLVGKYYYKNAIKIATDHNFHQNSPKYINELINSLKGFNYLVVATKELRDFYASKTSVKCIYIPNPLSNIPPKQSPLKTKNIISVGRLVPEKDFSILIQTMQLIHQQDPEIHLTIIGDGTERQALQSQINSLNLKTAITLTGWLHQDKIAKYYYNSSLFVMTSKTEAFGLVLTEAMSYGLPCLALARASGACAQITKDTGFLLDTSNPTIIADKIIELLNHPNILKTIQKQLESYIGQYSKSTILQSWLKILK